METKSQNSERWLARLLSTEPIDHARGEELLRELYVAAGMPPPKAFLWHTSPLDAVWTFGALTENHSDLTASFIEHVRQRSDTLAKLKQVQTELQSRLGVGSWAEAPAAVGPWHSASAGFGTVNPLQLLPTKIKNAQVSFVMKTAGLEAYQTRSEFDTALQPLQAAERQVFGHHGDGILAYGAANARAESLRQWMGRTIYNEYSYMDMARDEMFAQKHGASPPRMLELCWELAAAVGLWWPFANAVVLAERPIEVQHDEKGALTFVFADGWKGEPYASRTREPSKAKAKAGKADELLSLELPRDHQERLAFLRKRSPNLRLYDRYVAGEREQVWRELVDLGPDVRTTAHITDALAVAYETMTRVDANVKTIIQRLEGLGYAFQTEAGSHEANQAQMKGVFEQFSGLFKAAGVAQGMERMFETLTAAGSRKPKDTKAHPHVPPDGGTWKKLRKLEKAAGPLPLSLRAFYDVVGEVNLMGSHAAIAVPQSSVAPDPLVVHGLDDALAQLDMDEPEDGELYLAIAPDDLHKANVSGSDPYSIRLPAPVADTLVEYENHGVTFVEYLRIVFAWGGFPGWENADAVAPPEVAQLREGLLPI